MLSTQPYKGSRDFFPEDMKIRNYIFANWRKVCKSFGYEEYDGPFLEPFELFAAKTGEEIVNEQLYYFEDKGKRKVAIRPEMTPTVSRMVAEAITKQSPTPLKWFSIANFWRYEKPQKGRLREFFQLNVDIFGEENVYADLEILTLNQSLMESFNAKPNMYQIRLNNRFLIDFLLRSVVGLSEKQVQPVAKAIDKKAKVSVEDFEAILSDSGLNNDQIKKLTELLGYTISDIEKMKDLPEKVTPLFDILKLSKANGLSNVVYDPCLIRGFDYYDGNVFEQFDMTEGNNRSMFGGGRYDGLISLFINKKVPAVGFAPGDVTLLDFLKSWDLLPKLKASADVFVTVFPSNTDCFNKSFEVANKLRNSLEVELYLNPDIDLTKQIKYADKKKIPFVIILGPDELKNGKILVKDMSTTNQIICNNIEEVLKTIYGTKS